MKNHCNDAIPSYPDNKNYNTIHSARHTTPTFPQSAISVDVFKQTHFYNLHIFLFTDISP